LNRRRRLVHLAPLAGRGRIAIGDPGEGADDSRKVKERAPHPTLSPQERGEGEVVPLDLNSSCSPITWLAYRGGGVPGLTSSGEVKPTYSNSLICSHSFAFSPRISREFCVERPPTEIRGRSATPGGEQGMPGADAPAAARGVVGSTRVSHHGHTGITRHSPRNGFNSLFRALPGDRAFLPPSPRGYRRVRPVRADIASATLDASVGASGPHDFAVRKLHRPSSAPPASTASRPTFVTLRNAPLSEAGRRGI
jgi:hypothetical protein